MPMPGPDESPPLRTPLCDLLGCEVPVLLAGMGGVARAELAAAVARAGGYAMLGMVRESPELIETEIRAYRAATDRPFAVNVIPSATDPALLQAQIARCLDLGVRAFTFFWDVLPEVIAQVKREGCLVLHQVGTLAAARQAEAAGADVIIAQGIEAGGHVHGRTGAFALAEAVLDGAGVPVVVSGGITTGRGLAAALTLGAQGVQCGTAFLATTESWAHDYHKGRVVAAGADDTVLTDVFVLNWPKGAAVRVLGNSVTAGLDGQLMGHDPATLPREVIAHDSGQPLLRYSTDSPMRHTSGALEEMALYAGQGVGAIRDVVPAADRLRRIVQEARDCLGAAMTTTPKTPGRYASPPCMAAEVDPAYFDPLAVDPEQARDVARWRRAERTRLRAERDALSVADRQAAGAAIAGHLADLLRQRFGTCAGGCSRATGRSRQSRTCARCWRRCTPKARGSPCRWSR
jgi:nitronate monooxygenase